MPTDLEQELHERNLVVREARTWIGTPYHHGAEVKGHGVDCARLISSAFHDAGLIPKVKPGFYTHDWHLHRNEEAYLAKVEEYCRPVDTAEDSLNDRLYVCPEWQVLPGNLMIWRIGRTFSHSALVSKWPNVIHASFPARCVEEISILNTLLQDRKMRVYSYWGH